LIIKIIKESKTWLLYITRILNFLEKTPSILLKLLGLSLKNTKYPPITVGLCRSFHETWQFDDSEFFKYLKLAGD
jgi:hypothetical protein